MRSKTGTGRHEWWLDLEKTWVATRMGDGGWVPFEVVSDGFRDHGFGPFNTLKATREWWKSFKNNKGEK